MSILNIQAPTEDNREEYKDNFYEILEYVYRNLDKRLIKIIIKDPNPGNAYMNISQVSRASRWEWLYGHPV